MTDFTVPKQRGFSLLELLVVLVIVGLMAGLVAPRISGSLTGMNLKTAGKKVAGALRYARSRAASEKAVYRSVVDVPGRWLTVLGPGGRIQPGPSLDTWSKENIPVFRLPKGVRFVGTETGWRDPESDRFEIRFYPSGASTGGTVVLADDGDRRLAVRVEAVTGGVVLDG